MHFMQARLKVDLAAARFGLHRDVDTTFNRYGIAEILVKCLTDAHDFATAIRTVDLF